MRVVDRLNALDERAGITGAASPRAWERSVRLWWLGPVLAVATVAVLTALVPSVDAGDVLPRMLPLLAILPVVFWAGFFYNERLRSLGRTPRYGRVPPGWPNETP